MKVECSFKSVFDTKNNNDSINICHLLVNKDEKALCSKELQQIF